MPLLDYEDEIQEPTAPRQNPKRARRSWVKVLSLFVLLSVLALLAASV